MTRRAWSVAVLLGAVSAIATLLVIAHLSISSRVDEALETAARPRAGLEIVQIPVGDAPTEGSRLWTDMQAAADGTEAQGRIVVATEGGLVELTSSGEIGRRWTTMSSLGLVDHAFTTVLSRGATIWAGTRSGVLTVIEGDRARSYQIDGGRQGALNDIALFEDSLYLATASGVVVRVEDDQSRAVALEPVIRNGAMAFAASSEQLFVAGGDGVLYEITGDSLRPFGSPTEELASTILRLTAVAWNSGQAVVGSPTGLFAVDSNGQLSSLRSGLFVTTLLRRGEELIVGTFDQGVLYFEADRLSGEPVRRALNGRRIDRLRLIDGIAHAFGPSLAVRLDTSAATASRPYPLPEGIASNHVTALSMDDRGRLWVGHFDTGVDILDGTGAVERHLPEEEDSSLSSVNALAFDASRRQMLVATSHGVMVVSEGSRDVLREEDGLIGESVTSLLVGQETRAFATSRGLTLETGGGMRSIYAFHGLPSNRLYALAWRGEEPLVHLVVGSLGGVAVVEGLQVRERLRAGPSGLGANWVTALAATEEGTFIGTMGGGISYWRRSGEVEGLELPDGESRYTVSPGALLVAGDLVLIGTQERGLLIFNWNQSEWVRFEQPLPGAAVTALATDEGAFYLGTDRGLMRFRLEPEAMGTRP